MLVAVGSSPYVPSSSVSAASRATPAAASEAPPVPAELLQPCPDSEGGFEQGQPMTPPAPGSQRLTKPVASGSWPKMSELKFESPGTRLSALLGNTTKLPSAGSEGARQSLFPWPSN